MFDNTPFQHRLREGASLCGILNSVPSPLLVEMIGRAGFDWVILDLEHLLIPDDTLMHCLLAAQNSGCTALVRVPEVNAKLIGRVLDAGANGIVLPLVESAAQVEAAVAACRFPPLGRRGITGGRVTGFGQLPLSDYIHRVNEQILLVPMIESAAGLAALPEILAVEGVSMLLEGALDLALDLGLGPQPEHPEVQLALQQMAATCRQAGVPFVANPRTAEQRANWYRQGVRLFLAGEDRGLLFRALQQLRATTLNHD